MRSISIAVPYNQVHVKNYLFPPAVSWGREVTSIVDRLHATLMGWNKSQKGRDEYIKIKLHTRDAQWVWSIDTRFHFFFYFFFYIFTLDWIIKKFHCMREMQPGKTWWKWAPKVAQVSCYHGDDDVKLLFFFLYKKLLLCKWSSLSYWCTTRAPVRPPTRPPQVVYLML